MFGQNDRKLSIKSRYTLLGILFGLAFPVAGLIVDGVIGGHGASYRAVFQNNPIHYIVLLAPFVLGATFHVIGRKAQHIEAQLEQLIRTEEQCRVTTYRDGLTRLQNRRAFIESMADLLEQPDHGSRSAALILFDIDRFKFINETLGHRAGDELIREVVNRARALLPDAIDLYRLGGDDFVGLWRNPPEIDSLLPSVSRLVSRCAEPFALSETSVTVGVSAGVSWTSSDDNNETQALGRADLALYHAKSDNGGTYAVFDVSMAENAAHRVQIQQELKQALLDDQLRLAYQPVMHVDGRRVAGFEALIRWQHPLRGLIMPDLFIEIAEQSGLIVGLGEHVLRTACAEATSWPDDVSISINVSPVQFKDRSLVETVAETLRETGLPAGRLILEITESIFQIDPDMVREALAKLRMLGVRIALDDFGTGFSGINHLRHFAVDILKIDRQYTQAMLGSDREHMLVQTIVNLARALDLNVTFEGVERREELEAAADMGATYIQGYYSSPPLSADGAKAFIERHAGQAPGRIRQAAKDMLEPSHPMPRRSAHAMAGASPFQSPAA